MPSANRSISPFQALLAFALAAGAVAYAQVVRKVSGAPFSVEALAAQVEVVLAVLILSRLTLASRNRRARYYRVTALSIVSIASLLGTRWLGHTAIAVAFLVSGSALLFLIAEALLPFARRRRIAVVRWLAYAGIVGAVSACAAVTFGAIDQMQGRFSEEEFFVAIRVIVLAGLFALVLCAHMVWAAGKERPNDLPARGRLELVACYVPCVLYVLCGTVATIRAYQHSFYPPDAPPFDGISEERPFVVTQLAENPVGGPDGGAIFGRLIDRLAESPKKKAPEYGMLALATGDEAWAARFRDAILEEAAERRYVDTSVTNIHYGQHLAAYRLYYLWKLQAAFPDLFEPEELRELQTWFEDINRMAFTVKPRDCLYATALSKWPEGPYENQEVGAGLIALLEVTGYATPTLADRNRSYLTSLPRGWLGRFRNNDDTYLYQVEWIDHAFSQSLWAKDVPEQHVRHAFEWLLLQQLPGGAVLEYNHPAQVLRRAMPGVNYLGATLLRDPRYLWLADRALTYMIRADRYPQAQPGVERPVDFAAVAPTAGTALLYGNSGVPNQRGPLGPDKIVFRDGWDEGAAYLLMNLRFTGWHRYKATNTITLLYQNGPLAKDQSGGEPFAFLPEGRTYFRDKRVPRENLNGLAIERGGLSAVLFRLTGQGGPWAQDPPHFARVARFDTLGGLDCAHVVLDDWNGWRHDRTVYFFHKGPILIVDRARGRLGTGRAGVAWHLIGDGHRDGQRLWLRQGDDPACAVWPGDAWPHLTLEADNSEASDQPNIEVLFYAPQPRSLDLATVFLSNAWTTGSCRVSPLRTDVSQDARGQLLEAGSGGETVAVLHNASGGFLATNGLATDGDMVAVRRLAVTGETDVYAVGGTRTEVAMARRPRSVVSSVDGTPVAETKWAWRDGTLTLLPKGAVIGLHVR